MLSNEQMLAELTKQLEIARESANRLLGVVPQHEQAIAMGIVGTLKSSDYDSVSVFATVHATSPRAADLILFLGVKELAEKLSESTLATLEARIQAAKN